MTLRAVLFSLLATFMLLPLPAWADPFRGQQEDAHASAQTTPDGGGQVQAELTVPAGDAGSSGGASGGSKVGGPAGADNPAEIDEEAGMVTEYWQRAPGAGGRCRLPRPGVTTESEEVLYQRIQHDARTGISYIVELDCRDPAETPDPPAPPPRAPTVGEITDLARARIDPPIIGVNPGPEGLTGLETRLWDQGPGNVSVSLDIRGYRVSATMTPAGYCWHPGDPAGDWLCSHRPGSEDDWAAEWMYETKGVYELTAETVWNGAWTFSGHGASASGDLATIRTTATRDYPVVEVRSRLTTRP